MYSFLHTKPISWSDLITYPRWRYPARWSTWLRVLGCVHAPSRRGAVRTWWLGVWRTTKRWWDLALPVRVCWLLSAWLLSHGTEPRRGACICPLRLVSPASRPRGCLPLYRRRLKQNESCGSSWYTTGSFKLAYLNSDVPWRNAWGQPYN
jgi:hypothetical protein